jgi:hypothetical protein
MTSALDGVSGQRHASAALYLWGKDPGTQCTGGWVVPGAALDTEARGKICCLCRGSNLDRPVVQTVVRHYTAWAIPAPNKPGINYFIFAISTYQMLLVFYNMFTVRHLSLLYSTIQRSTDGILIFFSARATVTVFLILIWALHPDVMHSFRRPCVRSKKYVFL